MIEPGESFPSAHLTESLEFGDACPARPSPVETTEALKGKRVVIFGLPGAYTMTCSAEHLPGYVANIDALKAKGIDEVWCVSVNDGQVMAAWGKEHGAIGKVRMLGDGAAELTRKLGLAVEIPTMGTRMQRCVMIVDDGIVKELHVEKPREFAVSGAEHVLARL